jgi:hypothetical protein
LGVVLVAREPKTVTLFPSPPGKTPEIDNQYFDSHPPISANSMLIITPHVIALRWRLQG